jgi:homocitrate synthase NifV
LTIFWTAAPARRFFAFFELLAETGVDAIELSERVYSLLRPLPGGTEYVLRLENPANAAKYPELGQFVCRDAAADAKVRAEIVLDGIREAYAAAPPHTDRGRLAVWTLAHPALRMSGHRPGRIRVRIQGLDDVMLGDYTAVFEGIRGRFGEPELCPMNRFHVASAIAAEWAASSPSAALVTAFGGIGGFAPTEELLMILRLHGLRGPGKSYAFFPEMAALFQKIAGQPFRRNKPVIGKEIFYVESGVHVDGIRKHPQCYEPFSPEAVGQKRKIVIGKQSGTSSVRWKLEELGIRRSEEQVALILERVKQAGTEKNRPLSDGEFAEIVRTVRGV